MSILTDILRALGLIAPVPIPRASQTAAYVGMDQGVYFGLSLLNYFQAHTNIAWVGGYLDSPAPFAGELAPPPPPGAPPHTAVIGHHRGGTPPGDWMAGLQEARHAGWGVLPLYWGEQDPANAQGPWDLRAVAATNNAQDAIAKSAAANLDPHCVLYIDYENGGPPIAAGVSYLKLWFELVAEAGFRPGLYAHSASTIALRSEWPDLAGWVTNPWVMATQVLAMPVRGSTATFNARDPAQSGDRDALAWQMWFTSSTPWPPGFAFPRPTPPVTFPLTFPNGGAAISGTGKPQLDLDVSSSSVGDPGFPERRCAPGLVRRGRLSAAALDNATIAMFAVRRGALVAGAWNYTAAATTTQVSLPQAPYAILAFNPWSSHATLTRATSGDLAIVARSAILGTTDNAWEIAAYRRRGTNWTIDRTINATIPVDPLLGVALCSRAANTVEAFFITSDGSHRLFATSCVDAASQTNNQTWLAPTPISAPNSLQPSLVGGIGAVSPDSGIADVFVVARLATGQPWQLFWNQSSILGTWPNFSVPGDPAIVLHPFSNVAAISRGSKLMDVFAFGKGPFDTNWIVYRWWWNAAQGWGTAPPAGSYNTQPVQGTTVRPHPVSKIAAVSRAPQEIDVFVVGHDDGLLYTAVWDGTTGTWTDYTRVGRNVIPIASVDAAVSRASGIVDVIATGRDGNVYVATSTSAGGAYNDLTRVAPFNLK